jgi:dihydroflavonol-4-reductase
MKVLVTGATGFVGSWLTKLLLDRGHEVLVLSRNRNPAFRFDASIIEVKLGEVGDLKSLEMAFQDVHTVFHLAGVVGYSRAMRAEMNLTNVLGTANVISACQKSSSKLVHMSSVVAIGASFDGKIPLNEESAYNIHHLDLGYFETKHEAELLVKKAVDENRIKAVILNPSTIYGAGDAKKGSRTTQVKVAEGLFPFYTAGGVNVIHISDVISAIYAAWEIGRNGERYILAGENLLIRELFEIIATEAGVEPPRFLVPNPVLFGIGKIGDTLEKFGIKGPINTENAWSSTLFHWFDNSKAKTELKLNPRPAKEAIRESVRWMKENGVI